MGAFLSSAIDWIFGAEQVPVAMILGLDGAGKTTLFAKLLDIDQIQPLGPTNGINFEDLEIDGTKIRLWEMGGAKPLCALWRQYLQSPATKLLVWVVDASDPNRLGESKEAMFEAMENLSPPSAPMIIVSNKSNFPNGLHMQAVSDGMGLDLLRTRRWTFVTCHADTYDGVEELKAQIGTFMRNGVV